MKLIISCLRYIKDSSGPCIAASVVLIWILTNVIHWTYFGQFDAWVKDRLPHLEAIANRLPTLKVVPVQLDIKDNSYVSGGVCIYISDGKAINANAYLVSAINGTLIPVAYLSCP